MLVAPARSISASVALPRPVSPEAAPACPWRPSVWLAILTSLTIATFLIHGYHPLADDGGLYAAGIELKLDPTLFPHYTVFVTEHLHFSVFAPTIAAASRLTHLSLAWTLLLADIFTIFLTLYAARSVLRRCVASQPAQFAGLCLFSAFWTLPIAGTSLFLMDPYLTARSLSTPLALLAIAFALDPWPCASHPNSELQPPARAGATRLTTETWVATGSRLARPSPRSLLSCFACLLIAALFHPLMAAYSFAFIAILRLTRRSGHPLRFAVFLIAAIALAASLHALAPSESSALIVASHSRYYWFLSQWRWFEIFGLIGPLLILSGLWAHFRTLRSAADHAAKNLCVAAFYNGILAATIALLFAHRDAHTHFVARLQPLRSFLFVYEVMTLLLGATLLQLVFKAQRSMSSSTTRRVMAAFPCICLVAIAAIMFRVQRVAFPASPHLEIPWQKVSSLNSWSRAFLWARDNTPQDALFALDADYINQPGEDAQTFRATALRSALPDASKDGGEAAITPALAVLWQSASSVQTELSTESDTVRDTRLLPFHATWLVIRSSALTAHSCPYDNGTVKVCSLHQ